MAMRRALHVSSLCVCLCLWATIQASGSGDGQHTSESLGGPLTGPPVLDAPFSADAITTVRLRWIDGSRLEQSTAARFYRDREGRVRVEHEMPAPPSGASMAERHLRTVVDQHPGDGGVHTLDPLTRTARSFPRGFLGFGAGGGRNFRVPIGGVRFSDFWGVSELRARGAWNLGEDAFHDELLGRKQIDGLEVAGRRLNLTIPSGQFGNDRPIEISDELWESAELGIVIAAHHTDSRTGSVDYRVTNIRRTGPSADLFTVPVDYTIDTTPALDEPWLTLIPPEHYQPERRHEGPRR
jgi:hypothetical protein